MELGALRHGDSRKMFVDETSLEQLMAASREHGATGPVSRVDHPGEGSELSRRIGNFRGFRRVSGAVVADLHLLPASPHREFILALAEEDPASFGASILAALDHPAMAAAATSQGRPIRIGKLESVDIVDKPSATNGLLPAEFSAEKADPAVQFRAARAELFSASGGHDVTSGLSVDETLALAAHADDVREYFADLRGYRTRYMAPERAVFSMIYDREGRPFGGDTPQRALLRSALQKVEQGLAERYGRLDGRLSVETPEQREALEAAPGKPLERMRYQDTWA